MIKSEKGRWGVTLTQAVYEGWIWEIFVRREEGIMSDTAMRPHTLERKQESHSERQKKAYFGTCFRSAAESD